MTTPLVTPWAASTLSTESTLTKLYAEQGLSPYPWSNAPHDTYSAHSHSYDKVIYVVRGSITFGLPELGQQLTLQAGDRLDLPANTVHNAVVGSQGVMCLEAHI
jgi:quercetin dioxygenase-like cupin family protein